MHHIFAQWVQGLEKVALERWECNMLANKNQEEVRQLCMDRMARFMAIVGFLLCLMTARAKSLDSMHVCLLRLELNFFKRGTNSTNNTTNRNVVPAVLPGPNNNNATTAGTVSTTTTSESVPGPRSQSSSTPCIPKKAQAALDPMLLRISTAKSKLKASKQMLRAMGSVWILIELGDAIQNLHRGMRVARGDAVTDSEDEFDEEHREHHMKMMRGAEFELSGDLRHFNAI